MILIYYMNLDGRQTKIKESCVQALYILFFPLFPAFFRIPYHSLLLPLRDPSSPTEKATTTASRFLRLSCSGRQPIAVTGTWRTPGERRRQSVLRYSLYPCASRSRVSSFVCSICILPLPSCFAHSYFNWYTSGPILYRSPVPIPSFQSFRWSVLVILCDKAVGVLCLFREVFSVIGSMFGLGSRKVLKYSAIDTSLSIDVEDTVTCFCRSVFASCACAHLNRQGFARAL